MNFLTLSLSIGFFSCCIGLGYQALSEQQKVLLPFSQQERALIATHGPWPATPTVDASNAISNQPLAALLGKTLFFDAALSPSGSMSCASCHQPDKYFADGLPVAQGVSLLERNTPSLLNAAQHTWFGWGGESDSLWSHSIIPLIAKDEMASSAEFIQQTMTQSDNYKEQYTAIFSASPREHTSEQVLVNIAKALAAYQQTLVTPPSEFDTFKEAILNDNLQQAVNYSLSAQRGLKLFIGKGNCSVCHFGANFSNGEFADIGVPFFTKTGVDAGRYNGIKKVKASPYNRLGQYNDAIINNAQIDNAQNNTQRTASVTLRHRNWGEFKVPSLRGIKNTAPYMHDGSLATLAEVIEHYSSVSEERLHADGEKIIRALNLTPQESNDLLAFLKTL